MSKIYVVGDVHGHPMESVSNSAWSKARTLTEDDFVIFLGDFGVLWNAEPDKTEEKMIAWLDDKPYNSLVIGGNHDNWDRLRTLPIEKRFGVDVGVIGKKVSFIPNGTMLNLHGKKIFCFGGAMSTDKAWRVEHYYRTGDKVWWEGEIPTREEMDYGSRQLEKENFEVDVIVSHTMPSSSVSEFCDRFGYHQDRVSDPTARFLEFVKNETKYSKWFCGHFHKDLEFGGVRVCYDEIVKI